MRYKGKIVDNKDLVTKEYADTKVTQYETLPTAGSDYKDKIVQYIGATTTVEPKLTNGYFYKCVEDTSTTPSTYKWDFLSTSGGFLPLAGGTMTGTITTGTDAPMIIDNSGGAKITTTNDDNTLKIVGSTAVGSSLTLTGGNESSYAGGFELEAKNDTASLSLLGKPDGTLTWGTNDVMTFDKAVYSTTELPDNLASKYDSVIVCYNGTDSGMFKKGHLYKKRNPVIEGLQVTFEYGGTSQTQYASMDILSNIIVALYSDQERTTASGLYANITKVFSDPSGSTQVATVSSTPSYYNIKWEEVYTTDLSGYLPLAGGTMTGQITFSSGKKDSDYLPLAGGIMTGSITSTYSAGTPALKSNSDGGHLIVSGGSTATGSAYLSLFGKDSTDNTGAFSLNAQDASTQVTLLGKPDGTLTWGGNNIGIQIVSTMPAASASLAGRVYQFIGATTTDYTQGYFYICVNNSGTYSWQSLSVQPGIKRVADTTVTPTEDGWYYVEATGKIQAFIKD